MIYTEVSVEPYHKARFKAVDEENGMRRDIAGCDIHYFDDDLIGVYNVWTDADYRQRGLAEELLRQALAAARGMGYEKAFLTITGGNRNVAAEHLYLKLGFRYVEPPQMVCPRMELRL